MVFLGLIWRSWILVNVSFWAFHKDGDDALSLNHYNQMPLILSHIWTISISYNASWSLRWYYNIIKGRRSEELIHSFAAASGSANADLGHRLSLWLQQEHIFDREAQPHPKPRGNKYPFLPSAHLWISAGGRVCWPSQSGWLLRQHFPKILQWFTKYFLSSITHDFQSCAVTTRSAWWSPQALFTPLVVSVASGTRARTHAVGVGGGRGG